MASPDPRNNEDDEEDDPLERCPRCNIHFATEVSIGGDDVWPLPVPISCQRCGGSTLCKLCVDRVAQCSACGHSSSECFNKTVPNVAFCRALDRIRDLKATTSVGASSTEVNGCLNTTAATATTTTESPLEVGQRAYCLWEEDGLYYPGRIAVVLTPETTTAGQTHYSYLYTVHFDDGDVRLGAPRREILTLDEAKRKDLVVAAAVPGTENRLVQNASDNTQQGARAFLMGRQHAEDQPPYSRPTKKGKHLRSTK